MDSSDLVETIKGVGSVMASNFAKVGIETINDLIESVPRRYDDYSQITAIDKLRPGVVTIQAKITNVKAHYVRRGMHITEAMAQDASGSVKVSWFNQPYRASSLKPDQEYFITGEFGLHYRSMSIQSPSIELVSDFPVNTARIVPKYRETKGLKSTQIRKVVKQVLPSIRRQTETLPEWILTERELVDRAVALENMHFPSSQEALDEARRRLGFEEVFQLTLAALLNKQDVSTGSAPQIKFDEATAKEFVSHLPFVLTDDQRKAIWQIYKDIEQAQPMNRLLEGDVGSGKTVVAAMSAVMVIKHGLQVVLMAPTEILARQHAETLHKLLTPLGLNSTICLLVGGMTASQKSTAHKSIASGESKFIIGTHALIQDKVDMHSLGLVIIDEQHRFGVEQRQKLQAKAGHPMHVMHLTATPIPRSLTLTLYGELDVSILAEKPSGRGLVQTKLCSPNSRKQFYESIDKQIEAGRQVFVVCPLITESEKQSSVSVEKMHDKLQKGEFKHRKLGLLHGKMKPAEKEAVMLQFVKGEIDILVSTTVIEVGVDVPNVSVMVIEGAERFGLAQLHQLRGRIGRGEHQSYCYLVPSGSEQPSVRLRALESTNDGFALAEYDLEIRGPGAIYGTTQHGALDVRVAKLTDVQLISEARQCAKEFISRGENLLQYPELSQKVSRLRSVTNLN
jgi:ATP-dependent DNA helicase RecG